MNLMKKKLNKKGFTLAELLVVVAIIAVLVAISIPVFGSAMGKARHAADLANVRAEYAEKLVNYMTSEAYSGETGTATVYLKTPAANGSVVSFNDSTDTVSVVLDGKYTGSFTVDSDVSVVCNSTGEEP